VSSLAGLKAGDHLVVRAKHTHNLRHLTVKHVGRTWLTDNLNHRYRISDGMTGDTAYADEAMSMADWEVREETERLTTRLAASGWVPKRRLPLPQLRRAAALLSEFESESNGGML
jgi:hypothetical protein